MITDLQDKICVEDVPGYFHIYDEYSDNCTEISITEKEWEIKQR